MILTPFESLIIAHIIGDYFLQTRNMAFEKCNRTWKGFNACYFHCCIYTICICCAIHQISLIIFINIFLSHYIIDRYSLADKFLRLINGRCSSWYWNYIAPNDKMDNIQASFTAIVYAVIDNTMHILLMLLIFKFYGI
jgi:hypothetical protein